MKNETTGDRAGFSCRRADDCWYPQCSCPLKPVTDKPARPQTTEEPVISEWIEAYARWLPGAIANGHTEVNDAFRAGFLLGFKAGNDYAFPGETNAES